MGLTVTIIINYNIVSLLKNGASIQEGAFVVNYTVNTYSSIL